jgi:hypothetical protein
MSRTQSSARRATARKAAQAPTERAAKVTVERTVLYGSHPVVTRAFQFPTPPLVRAFDLMTHTIASGAPSCAFTAFPRFGKTWAIAYSKVRLREVFPSTPIVTFHAHHELKPNAARFYRDLLNQSGYDAASPAARSDPREQLVRALQVLAQSHSSNTLVLIGDEMQCLSASEYSWLIDLSNDLQALSIRVISIFFGQPELASLRTVLRETHRGDILGRFMSRLFAFDGISSARELQELMSCYDDETQGQYPSGSGCSFTQFFLPRAYDAGWRLASCAAVCWEQFTTCVTSRFEARAVMRASLGMEWIAGALQYVLVHFGDLDQSGFSISPQQWHIAIESTGFPDSLGLTYHPDWSAQL